MRLDGVNNLSQYEIVNEKKVSDLNSNGMILRHKKTGARIFVLSNDDENKVFYIGFRTPPKDSTGLPHIMEHSVLCGSNKFPAKDPFVELAKGSLNTFLNAMTYPDKTVYPVASCNDKDFQNLIHVYLDAVFYPNIFSREQIFKQEGWHYELDNEDADITINGVVYNEMKGAFSSPDDSFEREVFASLFPDTEYSNESGGDPQDIPTLKYSDFLEFHRQYYHPSNCYIYLYGDMDVEEKLRFIDEEYLSSFDRIDIDSKISFQEPFDKTAYITKEYGIGSEESEDNNTYLSYNVVAGTSLDRELYIAFQIISYAIIDAPGAVLTQTLLDKGIGNDVLCTFENGIYQPFFSIIAKNAKENQLEEFLATVKSVLSELVEKGIDKKALLAGINAFEFQYREADFGSYPKGLMYGLQCLDSWLYNDNEPYMHIEASKTYALLRNKIDSGYFEELIKKYLLDNTHSSVVVYRPKKGLTVVNEKKLKDRLADYKASLSKEEIDSIISDTVSLHEYQLEPSTKDELDTIPLLSISDIRKEAKNYAYEESDINGVKLLTHDIFTNGIGYLNIGFKITDISDEQYKYVSILKMLLGYVNTENYSYNELANEINENCGGIYFTLSSYTDANDCNKVDFYLEIKAKMFTDKISFVISMIKEIISTSDYTDDKRVKELIGMLKSRTQGALLSSGHSIAAIRALAHVSRASYEAELTTGLEFYRYIEKLDSDFDNMKEQLYRELKECLIHIFRVENMFVDYTDTKPDKFVLADAIDQISSCLYTDKYIKSKKGTSLLSGREAFRSASKVQYVAVGGNYIDKGCEYSGALRVLKVIMGYDYLWNNVRVKGGAYGCMSSFGMSGNSYFTSYRDPNLKKTLDIYRGAGDYVENFDPDERAMQKYIIGAVAALDTPLTPCDQGARSRSFYLSNMTFERLQKERDEVLNCSAEDIRKLRKHIDAFAESNNICVIGNEETINECSDMFDKIENLFSE